MPYFTAKSLLWAMALRDAISTLLEEPLRARIQLINGDAPNRHPQLFFSVLSNKGCALERGIGML